MSKTLVVMWSRWVFIMILAITLTGCFYWLRAYQMYLQMGEFDRHFFISVADDFTVHFKDPVLFSEDFVSLAKLRPSEEVTTAAGAHWYYHFRKSDKEGNILLPEVQFSLMLTFNQEDMATALSFSSLFLQIAPAEFLELSFRAIGRGAIDKDNRQLTLDTAKMRKGEMRLPLKSAVVDHLGEPFVIEQSEAQEVYLYYFILEAHGIKKGYQDRTLSAMRLSFDNNTQELISIAGRFAGLNMTIAYR